jgi:hypothetical protein
MPAMDLSQRWNSIVHGQDEIWKIIDQAVVLLFFPEVGKGLL